MIHFRNVSKACFYGYIMLTMTLFASAPCFSETIKDTANNYFRALKKDFNKLVANQAIKNPRTSPVNGLFVNALKRHLPITTLVRVNAKGIIINEVVRGEIPKKKISRKIGKEEWYAFVAKNKKEYFGFTEEENGRYYLHWGKPVLLAKKRFGGAVAMKIDIWDCFHMLSKETTDPYLVRIAQKSLYSHKWKNEAQFVEEPLAIPGIEKATILFERPAAATHAAETLAASVQRDTSAIAGAAASSKASADSLKAKSKKASSKQSINRMVVIIIGIIVVLILIVLLIQFYVWLNHKFLMRSINKSD